MDLDDVAFGIEEKDLLPAAHREAAIIGIRNALRLEPALESLDVVGSEGDVAALQGVDRLAHPKAALEVFFREMHLGGAVGDERDVAGIALSVSPPGWRSCRLRVEVEHVAIELVHCGTSVVHRLMWCSLSFMTFFLHCEALASAGPDA